MNLLFPKFDPKKHSIVFGEINFARPKATIKNVGLNRDLNFLLTRSDWARFQSNYKRFLAVIFILTLSISMTLSSAGVMATGREMQLNLSHISCSQENIEVHFVVGHLPDLVNDYGKVNYVMASADRIAQFTKQTGGTAHYSEFIPAIAGTYEITSGSVIIDDTTISLHNPQSINVSCSQETVSPTPSPSASISPSPRPTATPSISPTPSPSSSPLPSPTPVSSESPMPSPTSSPSATPSPSPTQTPSPTPSETATPSPTPSPTPSTSSEPSATPSANNSSGGGGGSGQGNFINGPLANQPRVLGTAITTSPMPQVLGATTLKILPDTGASIFDRILMSLFISVFVIGVMMVLIGSETMPMPILRKI